MPLELIVVDPVYASIKFDFLYRDITGDQEKLAQAIGQYDGIINATLWNPGNPRIITKKQIAAMKEGAVLVDNTCDVDKNSTPTSEGDPISGGVRYSFESKWRDPSTFYWVGPEVHTFVPASDQEEFFNPEHPATSCRIDPASTAMDPREFAEGTRVLYNANGMF